MTTEFIFSLEDRPGSFASVAKHLGSAGINIDAAAAFGVSGKGWFHLVTNNPESTSSALEGAGIDYSSNEVALINLKNEPGAFSGFAEKLAGENVNLTSFYITMSGQQVIGADNLDAVKKIASEWGAY